MSAYRFVTITCDGCSEVWDEDTTTSIQEARKWARTRHGWRTERRAVDDGWGGGPSLKNFDYCPRHPTERNQNA